MPRATWSGFLKLSLVSCPVYLSPATTEANRIRLNQLNGKTGNRVQQQLVAACQAAAQALHEHEIAADTLQLLRAAIARAEQRPEVLGPEEAPPDGVLEVLLPVQPDRAGDVRLGVERRVLVDLDDPERVVAQVVLHPLRVHENGVGVVSHGGSDYRAA